MNTKVKLKLEGMHCSSCVMLIEGDLEDLGVNSVKVNFAKSEAEIEYNQEKIKEEDIITCIKKTGYSAVVDSQPSRIIQ